jgi:hypothetical protein
MDEMDEMDERAYVKGGTSTKGDGWCHLLCEPVQEQFLIQAVCSQVRIALDIADLVEVILESVRREQSAAYIDTKAMQAKKIGENGLNLRMPCS